MQSFAPQLFLVAVADCPWFAYNCPCRSAKSDAVFCQGATFIFDNLISEALSHNELDLDASLERSKEAVKVGGGKVLSYVVQNGASLAKRCMAEVRFHTSVFSSFMPLNLPAESNLI